MSQWGYCDCGISSTPCDSAWVVQPYTLLLLAQLTLVHY